jgi:mannose-6-phosphate isomerase-like protein (cupin superfamily)
MQNIFHRDDLSRRQIASGQRYFEFLRVPALSAGVYVLPKGAVDTQNPHHQAEIYYVVRGRANLRMGDHLAPVSPGSVIFVEAEADHRFCDIEEELELLVFFAPAEQE